MSEAQRRIDDAVECFRLANQHEAMARELARKGKEILRNFPACEGRFLNSAKTHVIDIKEHDLDGFTELDTLEGL